MTTLTDARASAVRCEAGDERRFSAFALILSFALVMMGLLATERPRPDAATGDPFLFVLRP